MRKEKILFDGQYKPEGDQILEIENFSLPFEIDFNNPLNLEKIEIDDIDLIKGLIISDQDIIGFQCFDRRRIIEPSRLNIIFKGNTFSKLEEKGITIDDKLDVVFSKQNKSLLFYSYHNASKIFDLSEYYREATEQEINSFFEQKIFSNIPENLYEIIDTRMKKKIFLIKKNKIIEKLTDSDIFKEVAKYSKAFGLKNYFDTTSNKIKIPDDKKEFKKIISFLNEDLYKSPISEIIYETNSKREFR
ncbi:Kiwa anti-phage protein KwaB-like domain-containing protein [Rosettibacter firmus]|uniref:Kiwa anti-phage protein KwaB-like domain-containing protein n=1 Tax=Rosettibacter firmus TaxID=3111522 RepID=UPI00336BBD43